MLFLTSRINISPLFIFIALLAIHIINSPWPNGTHQQLQEKLNQTRSDLDLSEEAKRKTHKQLLQAKKEPVVAIGGELLVVMI